MQQWPNNFWWCWSNICLTLIFYSRGTRPRIKCCSIVNIWTIRRFDSDGAEGRRFYEKFWGFKLRVKRISTATVICIALSLICCWWWWCGSIGYCVKLQTVFLWLKSLTINSLIFKSSASVWLFNTLIVFKIKILFQSREMCTVIFRHVH